MMKLTLSRMILSESAQTVSEQISWRMELFRAKQLKTKFTENLLAGLFGQLAWLGKGRSPFFDVFS